MLRLGVPSPTVHGFQAVTWGGGREVSVIMPAKERGAEGGPRRLLWPTLEAVYWGRHTAVSPRLLAETRLHGHGWRRGRGSETPSR